MPNFWIQNPQNFKLQKISNLRFQFQNFKPQTPKIPSFKAQALSLKILNFKNFKISPFQIPKSLVSKISNFNFKISIVQFQTSEIKSFSKKHEKPIKVFLIKMKKVQIKKRQMKITHSKKQGNNKTLIS